MLKPPGRHEPRRPKGRRKTRVPAGPPQVASRGTPVTISRPWPCAVSGRRIERMTFWSISWPRRNWRCSRPPRNQWIRTTPTLIAVPFKSGSRPRTTWPVSATRDSGTSLRHATLFRLRSPSCRLTWVRNSHSRDSSEASAPRGGRRPHWDTSTIRRWWRVPPTAFQVVARASTAFQVVAGPRTAFRVAVPTGRYRSLDRPRKTPSENRHPPEGSFF